MNSQIINTPYVEKQIQTLENGHMCLTLRKSGDSYAKIGEQLGLSVATVRRLISRALKDILTYDVDELRQLEGTRLDEALSAIWPSVLNGDLRAIDRMLRISSRRSALFGLDMVPEGVKSDEFSGPAILEIIPYSVRTNGNGKAEAAEAGEAADAATATPVEGVAE